MTLEEAVEELYAAFSVPRPTAIECAPYELSRDEVRRLLEVPLRELTGGHLHSYVFELEVVGDRNVFLFFLPRLLELASAGELGAWDAGRILRRLERGGPLTPAQAQAVRRFLTAWWQHFLTTPANGGDAHGAQVLLLGESADLSARLRGWSEHEHPNAVWHLAVFVRWTLLPQAEGFGVQFPSHPEAGPELRTWISDPAVAQRLEDAFFAEPDGPAAADISDALTWWRGCVLGLWGPEG